MNTLKAAYTLPKKSNDSSICLVRPEKFHQTWSRN